MVRTKVYFIGLIFLLLLSACGKKGPVQPVDTALSDQQPETALIDT